MREALPPFAELEPVAAAAKALGDPTRLAVALALKSAGRACVCDLGWVTGKPEKLVSHHARSAQGGCGLARIASATAPMVMYELTDRGRALLASARPATGGRASALSSCHWPQPCAAAGDNAGSGTGARRPLATRRQARPTALLGLARLDEHRGHRRSRRRLRGELAQSAHLGCLVVRRGARVDDHHLAVHRVAHAFGHERADRAEVGGRLVPPPGPLLPLRVLRPAHQRQRDRVQRNPREGAYKTLDAFMPTAPADTRGVVAFDFDKDGWMDLAFTHQGAPGLSLWRNIEGKNFERVDLPSSSITSGRGLYGDRLRQRRVARPGRDGGFSVRQASCVVLRNVAGRFENVSAAVAVGATTGSSPGGLVAGDFDGDNDSDLLVVDPMTGPVVLRNDGGNANNAVRIALARPERQPQRHRHEGRGAGRHGVAEVRDGQRVRLPRSRLARRSSPASARPRRPTSCGCCGRPASCRTKWS